MPKPSGATSTPRGNVTGTPQPVRSQRPCATPLRHCAEHVLRGGEGKPHAAESAIKSTALEEDTSSSPRSNSSTHSLAATPIWRRPKSSESPEKPVPTSTGGRFSVPRCSIGEGSIPSKVRPKVSMTGTTADAMPKPGRLTTKYPSTTPSGASHSNLGCPYWRPSPLVARTGWNQ